MCAHLNEPLECQQCRTHVPTVTLVTADDWTGLFVDGKLVAEGHSLPEFRVIDALKDVGRYRYQELTANQDVMEEFGSFPETLEQAECDGIIGSEVDR